MQDIFCGVVIIGIGLTLGGSIFLGQFSLLNFLFDGLGIFFMGKGAFGMLRQNPESRCLLILDYDLAATDRDLDENAV